LKNKYLEFSQECTDHKEVSDTINHLIYWTMSFILDFAKYSNKIETILSTHSSYMKQIFMGKMHSKSLLSNNAKPSVRNHFGDNELMGMERSMKIINKCNVMGSVDRG
jgi:hypothetical protein